MKQNRLHEPSPRDPCSGNGELAFLGDPLESFRRTLDPILAVIALGREQPDYLVGSGRGRPRNIARREVHGRSDGKSVLQRPLHHTKCRAALMVPLQRPAGNWALYSMRKRALASFIRAWHAHGFR